jgi:hypothetical protein
VAFHFPSAIAAVLCDGLVDLDPSKDSGKAGPVLMELLGSPGIITRICAVDALVAVDYVDAWGRINDRYKQMVMAGRERSAAEAQEYEILGQARKSLGTYEQMLRQVEGFIASGSLADAEATVQNMVKAKPNALITRQAQKMLADAKKAAK